MLNIYQIFQLTLFCDLRFCSTDDIPVISATKSKIRKERELKTRLIGVSKLKLAALVQCSVFSLLLLMRIEDRNRSEAVNLQSAIHCMQLSAVLPSL